MAVCYFQIQASIATYTAILTATPELYSVGFTNSLGYIPVYIIRSLHTKHSYLHKTNTVHQKTALLQDIPELPVPSDSW